MRRLLHIAGGALQNEIFPPTFMSALQEFGGLEVIEHGVELSPEQRAEVIRQYPVLLTAWDSCPAPTTLVDDRGALRYICHLTGSVRHAVPLKIIEAGILVTNWGDVPAQPVAEGAMALLLAVLKDLHQQVQRVRQGGWQLDPQVSGGSLDGLAVGIYGLGAIGRRFVELIRPFKPILYGFDPYVMDFPAEVQRVDSLEDLFTGCRVVVIHAGLSDETRGSVNAGLLARLPDHGVIINTARGGIIDQEALFAELRNGRLRAGLDVTEPEPLPADHPARRWENLILSAHGIHRGWPDDHQPTSLLGAMHRVCLDNLRRFFADQPLQHVMDRTRYLRST